MKIQFAPDFKGTSVDIQVGDQRFEFHNGGTPFEVSEPVGQYCLRLPHFVATPEETPAEPVVAVEQEVAPRKK